MDRKIDLLVVDDNPADFQLIRRKVLQALALKWDVSFDHVEDFEGCIKLLQSKTYHCIILDYMLGDENGISLLKKIKPIANDTPVIFLTGEGDESVAVSALKAGASDYLVKADTTSESIGLSVINAIRNSELQEKLKDKQRELEDFAYTAAHDIKSPLATINQLSQLLKLRANEINDEEVSRYSDSLIDVSRNIIDFVNELLNYANSGRLDKVLEDVDINVAIEKAVENLRILIDQTHSTVNTEDVLTTVKADQLALMQLFQNIIQNSIKYRHTDRNPVITVSLGSLDKKSEVNYDIKILITDNGIGIPQKEHDRIFSPLVRVKSGSEVEGTGLGLAIARKIVDQHKGDIFVESSNMQGTTIAILLRRDPFSQN
jgi:signal transduction histidine kinase